MKKIFSTILKLIGVVFLSSCDKNIVSNTNSMVENSSSSSQQIIVSVNDSAESFLVEGKDYIDHTNTYINGDFTYDNTMWYRNNLDEIPLPDPHVYVEDGVYYITGTSDRNNDVIDMYVTEDFVTYEKHLGIYDPSDYDGWENDINPDLYAPEIYCFDGTYYMYYSAYNEDNKRNNSVLVSDSPTGPYEPLVNNKVNGIDEPLLHDADYTHELDITIFIDEDGQKYMYYAVRFNQMQYICGVKMTSPYEVDWSTKKELVKPGYLNSESMLRPLSWEMYMTGTQICEAPYMIKSNGKYYLTYSVNGCWNKAYSVCYAASNSPLGNFEKPYSSGKVWTNLLLGYPGTNIENSTVENQWSGFASGTGHHCFFKMGDQIMIGYHAHQNRDWNSETKYTKRYFAFDYLYFDNQGVPFCNGPTWSLQPLPEAISAYKNVAENAVVGINNVYNEIYVNDNYIVDCYNLSGENQKEVILGKGTSVIELTFDKEYTIGGFAIYNSAFYGKQLSEIDAIKYVDFGNGNAVYEPQFLVEEYVNDNTKFVFPGSAYTVEFPNTFKASKVVVCFNLPNGGQINEIKVLGK